MIAHYQRADETRAVLEPDFERPDVRHDLRGSVGEHDFPLREFLKPQLVADVLRDADVKRAGVGERIDLERQCRHARVAQKDRAHNESHDVVRDRNPRFRIVLPR